MHAHARAHTRTHARTHACTRANVFDVFLRGNRLRSFCTHTSCSRFAMQNIATPPFLFRCKDLAACQIFIAAVPVCRRNTRKVLPTPDTLWNKSIVADLTLSLSPHSPLPPPRDTPFYSRELLPRDFYFPRYLRIAWLRYRKVSCLTCCTPRSLNSCTRKTCSGRPRKQDQSGGDR